jgi:hypothetical protein
VEWTQEKAALVLETWQRRFSEVFSWTVFAFVLWFIWSVGCVDWSQLHSLILLGVKSFYWRSSVHFSFTPVTVTLLFIPKFHEDHCSWRGEIRVKTTKQTALFNMYWLSYLSWKSLHHSIWRAQLGRDIHTFWPQTEVFFTRFELVLNFVPVHPGYVHVHP